MSVVLFHAHSGLRYLVLAAAVVALVLLLIRRDRPEGLGRDSRIALGVYVGLLDLQILLGIILVATGVYYPRLIGHIAMMVLAAVAAHGFSVASRRAAQPRRQWTFALAAVAVSLLLIVLGIGAIGKSVLRSSPAPSVVTVSPA